MIRVGVGGWTFAPWRGPFYPKGLPHKDELAYASRHLTAIEINGTFYRTQSPASYRKWAEETPDNFVFALKGHRFVTNRKKLAEAGEGVNTFINSGILELGDKLGPINWQLAATKKFEPGDVEAFLALLPHEAGGRRIRHAVEARHESFRDPAFVELARHHGVAIVHANADEYPMIADPTADFVYSRLQRSSPDHEAGYPPEELDSWAEHFRTWHEGGHPEAIPLLGGTPSRQPRECFVFFISGEKLRNPAAAMALIERL